MGKETTSVASPEQKAVSPPVAEQRASRKPKAHWSVHQQVDYDNDDAMVDVAEVKTEEEIESLKQRCVDEGLVGFHLAGSFALLKQSRRPLTADDLRETDKGGKFYLLELDDEEDEPPKEPAKETTSVASPEQKAVSPPVAEQKASRKPKAH